MAILYKEYQDILGINPKYRTAISSLNEKQLEAYSTIVNLCADSIIRYDILKSHGGGSMRDEIGMLYRGGADTGPQRFYR